MVGTYLLRRHLVAVHALHLRIHLLRRLPIRAAGRGLHRARVHATGPAVFLILGYAVRAQGSVVGWCHGVLLGVARVSALLLLLRLLLLRRKLACPSRRHRRHGPTSSAARLTRCSLGLGRSLFPRNNVDEKVKHVGFGQGRGNVGPLECAALVLLGMDPGPHRQLGDEDVASLGKQYRRFGRDHLDLWIGLHDLFYPREWQLMQLVVVRFILENVDDLLPVGGEDVAIVAMQTLVYL